jgi:thymidylate synthase
MNLYPTLNYNGESEYMNWLSHILTEGEKRGDRTGTGTKSSFGIMMNFDIQNDGLPFMLTKRLAMKSIISELIWFLEGSTDERRLAEIHYDEPRSELKDKSTIWTANADAQGVALGYVNDEYIKELGPVYGYQWDRQIDGVVRQIKESPESRRIILNSWDVDNIDSMALPPCHVMCQFYVREGQYLDLQLYQRSGDMFLGVPFNIMSYSILLCMIASVTNLEPGKFTHVLGDAHIYLNHTDQVMEQTRRFAEIRGTDQYNPGQAVGPTLELNADIDHIRDFTMSDLIVHNYNPMSSIKADMAV